MSGIPVRLEREGDIGLILVDHPPANVLSPPVRQGLLNVIAELAGDPHISAGVIAGAGRSFMAGVDVREFDGPPVEPMLAAVTAALEALAKPVVASIHGSALGGGFEVALACHGRVIAPDGAVGLPEVLLGLIPSAGGTQRLPRLVGALASLELIAGGRRVPAAEALKLGLVDEVATDARGAAIARARELASLGTLPRLSERPVPPYDRSEFDTAVAIMARRSRGHAASLRAAEAVGLALTLPFAEGLEREQELARGLRQSVQARALRHLFHAERLAARPPVGAAPRPLARIGIVGGGAMGSGLAVALADAGLETILVEADAGARSAAEQRIGAILDRQVQAARLSSDARAERENRIATALDLGTLARTDLVIEAATEDPGIKRGVFRTLSGVVRRDAVLASTTSFLDIDALADLVDAPDRVLGLHFFCPAQAARLVEVVRAARTGPAVLATGLALARRTRKVAVMSGIGEGFIGNRILLRWRLQCEYALEEGALPEEVDAAHEVWGFAMGPFAAADMAGLDTGWGAWRRGAQHRLRERLVPIADWLCEQGRFGQRTGAGWYLHRDGKRLPDPVVAALVARASAARGIHRRKVLAATIQERAHAAMVNEAARILADGVAARPSDIDVVMVHGYGYPAWRGGPLFEADTIGLGEVLRRVEAMAAHDGPGWEPAPLLRELVRQGRRFADLES
ncbi:MAG TPA: 3-hydroxyacyl-CoA dehydrogenase NAD-binding domain-containing protein [Acetobacteraceae bacterium]|nr:3-hydroxyacyl-CoA dehydrogenase NAD-binding domain-containing protein [Acetobacteraceae bacterium]